MPLATDRIPGQTVLAADVNGIATQVNTNETDIAAFVAGNGTVRNAHAHSSAAALAITRAAPDQYTTVTQTANATGFTDSMSNGDILHLVIKNGTAADYTLDLSSIPTLADPDVDLAAAINVYETTVIVVLLEKVEGQIYAVSYATPVPGSAQAGSEPAVGANKTTATPAAAATVDIVLPTGISAGDKIYIPYVAAGNTAAPEHTATGFTTAFTNAAANTFRGRIGMLEKTAVGGEGGTIVTVNTGWTTGSAATNLGAFYLQNAAAMRAGNSYIDAGAGSINPPAITPGLVTDALFVVACRRGSTLAFGGITGYTEILESLNNISLAVYYKTAAGTAAEDPAAFNGDTTGITESHVTTIAVAST